MSDFEIWNLESVCSMLRKKGEAIQAKAAAGLKAAATDLQAKVQQDELSGSVLHVRSGALRQSIEQEVKGDLAQVFSRSPYARFQEYGFSGSENVSAHLRMMKQAFGRSVRNPHQILVSAHTREISYLPQSFMRAALKEMKPEIMKDMRERIQEAIEA